MNDCRLKSNPFIWLDAPRHSRDSGNLVQNELFIAGFPVEPGMTTKERFWE